MQTDVIREQQLNVRLSPAEMERAKRLAEHYGVTPANVVRLLLTERARELGLDGDEASGVSKPARAPLDRKSEPKPKKR